jgi:CubicO group peptidase (beta-lactamase class C family)
MFEAAVRSAGTSMVSRTALALAVASLLLSACSAAPAPAPRVPERASAPPAPEPTCTLERAAAPKRLTTDQLAALRNLATESDTDALLVVEDSQVVLDAGSLDRRYELMSVTKSVVSLAVGKLIDAGKLKLEQPVSDFIPEWKGTSKEAVLVRHLLEHTSGLDDKRTTEDIYASPDFVKFAIDAELKNAPGTKFFYSNRAVNLLAAIVEKAAGAPLDAWTKEHLFAPLGITDVGWSTDSAGHPQVMAGIQMRPADLAKLGRVVLDRGRCGKQIVSTEWLEASTRTYQKVGFNPHGLLWWLEAEKVEVGFTAELFDTWRASGVPEDFIAKIKPLEGQYFEGKAFFQAIHTALTGKTDKPTDADLKPWYETTWMAGRPDGVAKHGPVRTISADGYGGQMLLVYPELGVVLVRLREISGPADAEQKRNFQREAKAILFPKTS